MVERNHSNKLLPKPLESHFFGFDIHIWKANHFAVCSILEFPTHTHTLTYTVPWIKTEKTLESISLTNANLTSPLHQVTTSLSLSLSKMKVMLSLWGRRQWRWAAAYGTLFWGKLRRPKKRAATHCFGQSKFHRIWTLLESVCLALN